MPINLWLTIHGKKVVRSTIDPDEDYFAVGVAVGVFVWRNVAVVWRVLKLPMFIAYRIAWPLSCGYIGSVGDCKGATGSTRQVSF